ncbi:MAG: hypothetical protein MZV63_55650 [Marinilabiliales bacterium]|nr:hypothetical protein [Marinilabiliales bacterium]
MTSDRIRFFTSFDLVSGYARSGPGSGSCSAAGGRGCSVFFRSESTMEEIFWASLHPLFKVLVDQRPDRLQGNRSDEPNSAWMPAGHFVQVDEKPFGMKKGAIGDDQAGRSLPGSGKGSGRPRSCHPVYSPFQKRRLRQPHIPVAEVIDPRNPEMARPALVGS